MSKTVWLNSICVVIVLMFSLLINTFDTAPLAQSNRPSVERVRELIMVTGEMDFTKSTFPTQLKNLQALLPGYPEEYWRRYTDRILDDSLHLSLAIPIYQKYLSAQDVEDLIQFNLSETAKRHRLVAPLIFQEAAKAGNDTARVILDEIAMEMGLPLPSQK